MGNAQKQSELFKVWVNKDNLDLTPQGEKIKQELLNWKGVTIQEHNFFVTIAFYVEGVEMGTSARRHK
jgi:hypothetical protein